MLPKGGSGALATCFIELTLLKNLRGFLLRIECSTYLQKLQYWWVQFSEYFYKEVL